LRGISVGRQLPQRRSSAGPRAAWRVWHRLCQEAQQMYHLRNNQESCLHVQLQRWQRQLQFQLRHE